MIPAVRCFSGVRSCNAVVLRARRPEQGPPVTAQGNAPTNPSATLGGIAGALPQGPTGSTGLDGQAGPTGPAGPQEDPGKFAAITQGRGKRAPPG